MSGRLVLIPTALEARALLDEPPDGQEMRPVPDAGADTYAALVGFGLASSGVLAARHVAALRPDRCLLLGLAGSLRPKPVPVGSLITATAAESHGIGIGDGEGFIDAETLGFEQVPGIEQPRLALEPSAAPGLVRGVVVSLAAGSADAAAAERLRARRPEALAEDLETWAVALACRAFGLGLTVVRGVSNVAGDRDKGRWQVGDVLARLRERLRAGELWPAS